MNFWRKTKGAVSIFLVIILVPVMTVSSLFVDASKVKLARGVAESAGDLTLNTALTDYDTKLKDMYGLFATAQNTKELFSKLEDYYKTCITSSGVGEEDADAYVDQIMAQLGLVAGNDETSDILNMQLVDFEVSKKSDASLANATIMRKQIVDFMKYRAPINTGLSFLTSLQSFSTLSKQTELVDKRTEYYEEQQSVMEKLKAAWEQINTYNKTKVVTDDNYFATIKQNLNTNYKNTYQNTVNVKVIKDLYDTQNYVDYYCSIREEKLKEKNASGVESTVDGWKLTYTAVAIAPLKNYTEYYDKSVGGYDKDNLPNEDDIKTLMTNFYNQLQSMEANKSDIQTPPSDAYVLQYLVQNMRGSKVQRYTSSVQNVYTTYQKLKNAMIWVDGYDLSEIKNEDGEIITAQSIKDTKVKVNRQNRKISEHFADITGKYNNGMSGASQLTRLFSDYSTQVKDSGKTNTSGVNSTVSSMATTTAGYVTELENAAKALEEASRLIKEAKTSVESGGALSKAKNAWKSTASSSELENTSMAKQDLAEIDQVGSYLNAEEMGKMISRLDNVASNLRTTISQIKGYRYDDKYIGEITDYNTLKDVVKKKIGDGNLKKVPISDASLNQKVSEYFHWTSGNINIDWIDDSGKQVKLHGTGTDKLNFYSYLYTHFNTGEVSANTTTKTEDTSNGKDLYTSYKENSSKKAKDDAEAADDGNVKSENELNSLAGRPSLSIGNKDDDETDGKNEISTGDSAVKDTSKSLSTMFSSLSSSVAQMGVDLRDKLYISDYVLSMFSYDTIEKEYAIENAGEEVNLQSLTNNPINAKSNFAYGKEVEYIIYGGTNAKNIQKAYASIYGIRLGFNLIYAFADSSIRDTAFAIATPISAATLGVIPVPLIQAAIIIGVACCESALDLNDLRNGESIPLFKNSKTWKCSIKGLISEVKAEVGNVIREVGTTAIDQGLEELNGLLDMTDEQLTSYLNQGTDGVINAVTTSYDTLITRHANTAIQKFTTLCNNAIEENMLHPGTDMVQMVSSGLDAWLAEEAANVNTGTDLSYIVKKEAVEIIKTSYIQYLLDELSKNAENTKASVAEAANAITDIINAIRTSISKTISQSSQAVLDYKNQMKKEVENAMAEGAESLKKTLNNKMDGIFGTSNGGASGNADATGMASLLSFAYSDYLRLFLMIGLYTNEEAVLLRIGDAIQANMIIASKNAKYKLANSAVYVEMSSTIQIKPTLLALPLFADVEGNPSNNQRWYTIEYQSIKGY